MRTCWGSQRGHPCSSQPRRPSAKVSARRPAPTMPGPQNGAIAGPIATAGSGGGNGNGGGGGSEATRLPPKSPSSNWTGAKSVLTVVKATGRFQTLRGTRGSSRPLHTRLVRHSTAAGHVDCCALFTGSCAAPCRLDWH